MKQEPVPVFVAGNGGGLSITVTIDTAWAGDTTIYF
jgi:hypothetical protein